MIGNLLIHNLTLTYDKLKLFNPVATIKYTNTTTQQVVTIKKQPYEAIAKNLINNRLIDSNSLGIENLLNKIWVQGVNNHDFITAETDLLKDGFFMDMETNKVLSNNVFENLETSKDDVKKAVKLLDELIRGRGNAVKWDCTLFRFMLWSPFAYCLKQLGFTDDLYSMVLWGESDTNKTGSSVMFSKLYTDNDPLEEKANTQSAIGTMLGENTFPLILDEAKDNLENPNDEEFNKNIVTDKIGRAVKDRTNNNLMVTFPALRLTVRTLNKNLDDLLMSMFKSWFVYFDDVDEFKSDENLGDIPKSWSVEMLEDYVDFVTGVEPGSKNYHEKPEENDIPFIRVGDLGSRDNSVFIEALLSKNKILKYEDIVLSMDATIGIVKMGLEGAYSTGMRKLVLKNDLINKPFLYCLVKSERIQRIIETFATGTTILHAGKSIKHMNFVLPDKITMKNFEKIGENVLTQILSNMREIEKLTQLRDTLLPKLMSGEIDVSKIKL